MAKTTLKKQVLKLPDKERAQLAHYLIDSLNPDADFESEQAWSQELKNRISQYEKGQSSTKSWNQVKKNAQNILNK
jgi:putative addiction module component (TIGR02574 family)